jgi:D-ribose pyranase
MKKGTVLNPELARAIAALGHGDTLVVADAGLPIPAGVQRIDLAFAPGKPGFLDVLDAVLAEMEVERAILAEEAEAMAPRPFLDLVEARLLALPKVKARGIERVPHEELKRQCARARAVVRTGEFTPYANVVLSSGVVF